jgi:hypothetical protein
VSGGHSYCSGVLHRQCCGSGVHMVGCSGVLQGCGCVVVVVVVVQGMAAATAAVGLHSGSSSVVGCWGQRCSGRGAEQQDSCKAALLQWGRLQSGVAGRQQQGCVAGR